MALSTGFRRRRAISLTPLIDVIFLLLLFFMLSSTFTRFAELPLQNATTGAEPTETPPLFLRVEPGGLTLNGSALTVDALSVALSDQRQGDQDAVVLVSVTNGVTSQRLIDVLAVLRSAPWLTVSVLS